MDRICPFLALSIDHRTAVDGFDPDHLCHAVDPTEPLDRQRQAEQCLVEAHRQCDRYLAFLAVRAEAITYPPPAADAHLARTRLIVEPEARRLPAAALAPIGMSPRRWAVAGGVAVVGVVAAATAVAGGFPNVDPRSASGGATATPTGASLTPATPEPTPDPTAEPTSVPTRQPTPEPTRQPRESASPSASPQRQTYVVREGDTLSLIATRFGTSVSAIQRANGLGSDVITIGQVLVIP